MLTSTSQVINSNNKHLEFLKIATYNIQASSYPELIIKNIKFMKNKGVNIFALQEVCTVKNEPFIGTEIEKTLGKKWKAVYFYGKESELIRKSDGGLCIIYDNSLFQVIASKTLYLPKLTKLNSIDQWLNIFLGYIGEPSERKALIVTLQYGEKTFRVTNLHLDWHAGKSQRYKQLLFLTRQLKNLPTRKYDIICGDFNTLTFLTKNSEYKKIGQLFGNQFTEATQTIPWTTDLNQISTPEKQNTFFNKMLKKLNIHYYRKLDYIWIKGFQTKQSERLVVQGSDHFPTISELTF